MCAVAPLVLACVTFVCGVPPTKLLYFHGILRERGVGLRALGRDAGWPLVLVIMTANHFNFSFYRINSIIVMWNVSGVCQ